MIEELDADLVEDRPLVYCAGFSTGLTLTVTIGHVPYSRYSLLWPLFLYYSVAI